MTSFLAPGPLLRLRLQLDRHAASLRARRLGRHVQVELEVTTERAW